MGTEIDITEYGGWITPEGTIEHVRFEQHGEWARAKYGNIIHAFDLGCVSFTVGDPWKLELNLRANLTALIRSYQIWSKTAFDMETVIIDIRDYDKVVGYETSYVLRMPQDRRQLNALFGPSQRWRL